MFQPHGNVITREISHSFSEVIFATVFLMWVNFMENFPKDE